jgi:glycosyltransferase involved in cell wall biosynthesis
MRIAYLSSDPGVPVYGIKGASVHVRELSRALIALGHEVTVLTVGQGEPPAPGDDLPIVQLPPESRDETLLALLADDPAAGPTVAGDVRAILAAASLHHRALPILSDLAPDFVYERFALYGTAGVSLARELGVPHILEMNAPLSEEQEPHRSLAYRETAQQLETMVVHAADHVVAVSAVVGRRLVAAGVPPERVSVLSNGVDAHRFEYRRAEREAARLELGLEDVPVVGFVGTLKPGHDVATLVWAVALARSRALDLHLLIVGDGPERERLGDLVRREGLAGVTRFTGAVPHAAVASYVSAFDVAVMPYGPGPSCYFSPLKLFECLAAERPVVAADVGDVGHCIRKGVTGLLYTPGDAQSLANAIVSLLSDHERAATLARAGRDHVQKHHTWEGNARVVVELAASALDRKARSPLT